MRRKRLGTKGCPSSFGLEIWNFTEAWSLVFAVCLSGGSKTKMRRPCFFTSALPTAGPGDTVPPRDNLTTNHYAISVPGRFENPIRRRQVEKPARFQTLQSGRSGRRQD